MKRKLSQILSLVMAVILLCGLLPLTANAASPPVGSIWQNGSLWTPYGKSFIATDPTTGVSRTHNRVDSYVVVGDDGIFYPAYCVQPGIPIYSDTSNGCDYSDVTVIDAWKGLSASQRRAIALAMLYGYPASITYDDYRDKRGAQFATQVIIWEIIYGYRSATAPFTRSVSNFPDLFAPDSTGNIYTDGVTGANNGTVYTFHAAYEFITSKMAAHYIIPSFAASDEAFAQTYELSSNGDGTYSITLTDTNNILSQCQFIDTDDIKYTVSGDQLTITANKPLSTTVSANAYKDIPNVESQSFVFWTKDNYQTMITNSRPQTEDPVPIFFNLKTTVVNGKIKVIKSTNTGDNLSGWIFDIKDSTGTVITTLTTGSDGTAISGELPPGQYTVTERESNDSYWACDVTAKNVTVLQATTTEVPVNNTHYGRIKFVKSTNTGVSLGGWEIELYSDVACSNLVGKYITGSDGTVVTGNLLPGTYYAKEVDTSSSYPYWGYDTSVKTISVIAGQTADASFSNTHYGKIKIIKDTNTGQDEGGWQFSVYSDPACTNLITTVSSTIWSDNGDNTSYGTATTENLLPGTYYVKETGDQYSRWDNEYWSCDTAVKAVNVAAGQTASVSFHNSHYGKIKIIKTMNTDGPLVGWQFKITDSNGTEIAGSPFITTGSGSILTDNLLPGTYTVEEVLPSNSLYYCKSQNPQTITITPGSTAELNFTNALRPGEITIQKVNTYDEPLAGAKFLLEWSEDGVTWNPVTYSANDDVSKGYSTNNGIQTTLESGIITWTNLHPTLSYRVTELEAPEGYSLLTSSAFIGAFPDNNLSVTLRVVNAHSFTLPDTGFNSIALMSASIAFCMSICIGAFLYLRRKEN